MRELGIKGATRGKGIVITTIADESLEKPKDQICATLRFVGTK